MAIIGILGGPTYVGVTITLAAGATNYNILKLIQALAGYENVNPDVGVAMITADAANDNVNPVLVGDAKLSATNYAYPLQAGVARNYGPAVASQIPLANLWVRSVAVAQVLHIEGMSI